MGIVRRAFGHHESEAGKKVFGIPFFQKGMERESLGIVRRVFAYHESEAELKVFGIPFFQKGLERESLGIVRRASAYRESEAGIKVFGIPFFKKVWKGRSLVKIEKLSPAFKDYLWGGTKLRDVYGKHCDYDKVAESWELSTHPDGQSTISGGQFDGMTLGEYLNSVWEGRAVLGKNCEAFGQFPVLIKFIDAKDPLSIQVHPSDEYALRVEGEYGKTEMWYVMDCEPGAYLYFGVNREVTKEEFRQRIENNTVLEVLSRVDVHPGDVFFIEAGTLHAIGAGILICEIQQNSNTTYRVYDYDRRGADGKPRELHVDKALEVSRFIPSDTEDKQGGEERISGGSKKRLASCKYFTTEKYSVDGTAELDVTDDSFVSLIILEGSGKAEGPENTVEFQMGDSLFVPAGLGKLKVSGTCTFIKTSV